jgi:hypothetical protein
VDGELLLRTDARRTTWKGETKGDTLGDIMSGDKILMRYRGRRVASGCLSRRRWYRMDVRAQY